MPIGMGVADPKLVKGGRKPKKVKHCSIPKPRTNMKKKRAYGAKIENSSEKEKAIEEKMPKNAPNQVRGCF